VINLIDDSGLLQEFVLEADAHIAQIENGLLRMEEGWADEEAINDIFRAAHSIKGTASFFELTNIVELAHSMENVFGELREHRLKDSPNLIDTLLSAADMLKELLLSPLDSDQYDISKQQAALNRLIAKTGNKPRVNEAATAWDIWNELTGETKETPIDKQIIDEVFSDEAKGVSFQAKLPLQAKENLTQDSVRVNVGVLNELLTLAGEMVLRRNQLLRLTETAGNGQFEPIVKSIDELTTSLQKKIMQTRLQPMAHVFNKFPRIVRDLSRKVDKEVILKM
jgi:two-component system chemotaxis sensor kinase CheA